MGAWRDVGLPDGVDGAEAEWRGGGDEQEVDAVEDMGEIAAADVVVVGRTPRSRWPSSWPLWYLRNAEAIDSRDSTG